MFEMEEERNLVLIIAECYMDIPYYKGDRGSTVVKVLCYKSEGRWCGPSCCPLNFSLT